MTPPSGRCVNWINRTVTWLAVIVGAWCSCGMAAEPARRQFDLPAAPAEQSLKQFSAQSGLGVLFVSESVAGVRTNAVNGSFTPREALDLLLVDTSLIATQDEGSGSLRVRRNRDSNVRRVTQATAAERRPRPQSDLAPDPSATETP